ncbi:MAG: type transport system ATP-binding protein [Acidimicrobiaceae bacterium]
MTIGEQVGGTGRAVIEVDSVTKRFRLYNERNQTLKAAIMRGRRARYEDLLALDDVSLSVAEGTTVGLIGENGSGKSTLLKCMARILRPDKGAITVDGKISALLELGAGFHPELSGRENVYLNGSILGLPTKEIDRRFDDIVEFAGLARFIDSPVKNYSSGMYVRLGFSVAINVSPDILLIDEVLAVGDEQFQTKCAEKFAELRANGKTIVLVSHALGSVRAMCEQAVWLHNGKVRATGPAGDIADEYVSEMHQGREGEESHGGRWGSGEAQIDRVEVLGPNGQPTAHVRTGDPLTIRLHYRADESIPRPVFGVGIHTLGGVHVTGPNTREAAVSIEKIDGRGYVDLQVPRLLLLPGTYDISVSLADHEILHVFDFRQRAVRFDVGPGDPQESFGGVTSLGGTWCWQPDGD